MQTQSERSEAVRFQMPPLRMEITIGQIDKHVLNVTVEVYSGRYRTRKRSVVVPPDSFGAIPLTVENDLYQWVAWLCACEQARRSDKPDQAVIRHRHAPQWPSLNNLGPPAEKLEPSGVQAPS